MALLAGHAIIASRCAPAVLGADTSSRRIALTTLSEGAGARHGRIAFHARRLTEAMPAGTTDAFELVGTGLTIRIALLQRQHAHAAIVTADALLTLRTIVGITWLTGSRAIGLAPAITVGRAFAV